MLLLQSMRGCTKYGEYIEYDYVCPKEVDCQFLVVSSFRRWRVSAIWTKPVCPLYSQRRLFLPLRRSGRSHVLRIVYRYASARFKGTRSRIRMYQSMSQE